METELQLWKAHNFDVGDDEEEADEPVTLADTSQEDIMEDVDESLIFKTVILDTDPNSFSVKRRRELDVAGDIDHRLLLKMAGANTQDTNSGDEAMLESDEFEHGQEPFNGVTDDVVDAYTEPIVHGIYDPRAGNSKRF